MFKRVFLWFWLLFPFSVLANNAPSITSLPDTKVNEDVPYSYTIVATDEDGDTLTYRIIDLPTFLSYNSSNQTISGTPDNTDVGVHNVKLEVSDGVDTVSQQYALTVGNTNDAPTRLTNIENQTILEDETFSLNVSGTFTDEDEGDSLTFTAENLPSGLSISSTGVISGSANNDAAMQGAFTVSVIATDRGKATVTSDFQIVVINVNDAPEPFDDTVFVNEDSSIDADILENDKDVDNELQPSTLFIVTNPTHGTATIDTSNGLLTYTPDKDYAGEDTLTYRITDPDGLHGTATVTFTVRNRNDAPVANNDVFTTEEDIQANFDVLRNDTDIDEGDAPQGSQIIIESTASNGSVEVFNGMIKYVPNNNYTGTDSFTYKVADSFGAFSNVATVSVTVGAVNDIPIAGDDVVATLEDEAIFFVVINNDSDTEDGRVIVGSMAIVNSPDNGVVSIDVNGNMTYIPNQDFHGVDTLQYTITDSDGLTSLAATVTITVNPVNDPPVANSDIAEVDEDTSLDINILGNDTDIDGQDELATNSVEIQRQPNHGSLFLDTATGMVRYTPEADYFGTDSFTYQVSDTGGLTSSSATVQIDVKSVNDSPRLASDSITTDEDTGVTIPVLDNDIDVDGSIDSVTLNISQSPVNGTATITSDGKIRYRPVLNFHGSDQFSYRVSDNNGLVSSSDATVLVNVTSVNDTPEAIKGVAQTFEDKSISITFTGTDVDEDPLTFTIIQQPTHGTISGSGATRIYTPDENYHGADSLTFKASDGQLDSLSSLFVFDIISVNDRPVATGQNITVREDSSVDIVLSGTDIDGDDLNFSLVGSNLSGTITGSAPNITYTPPKNFNGQESFSFIANDGDLDSASKEVNVTVEAVNDVPTTEDQELFLAEDEALSFELIAEDVDGDKLTYTILSEPKNGTLSGSAPNLTYSPAEHYNGSDTLIYKVNDGQEDSQTATVSFEVAAIADAPTAQNMSVSGDEDTDINVTLQGSDPDESELSYQLLSTPTHGTLSGTAPSLVYHPNEDFNGEDSFRYMVTDGHFDSDAAVVTVSVNALNDAPVAVDDNFSRSMSGVTFLELDVLRNDIDIDGDEKILVSAQADIGSVAVNNNKLRYVPPEGFIGDVLIGYLMRDSAGETARAIVHLSITDNTTADDPVINTPNDISVVATGRITKVDLGSATAFDKFGNILPVELIDHKTAFKPGAHTVFWKATDSQGNTATASQKVNVFPLVSLTPGQTIEEGRQGKVMVKLNGIAPHYPVVVPYTVSGSATAGLDYELTNGEIRIDHGTEVALTFETFSDNVEDDNEQVIISLGDTPYKSNESTHIAKIVEGNIAPRADLFAMQNGQRRLRIENNDDLVSVFATITDANINDTHIIEWQADEPIERSNNSGQADYQFSAANLDPGTYHIRATVSDSHESPKSVQVSIFVEVVTTLGELDHNDSDGDLISDEDEGHSDSDADHIPDYLDPIDDCTILPEHGDEHQRFLIEGQSSGCLRLGPIAGVDSSGGAHLQDGAVAADPDSDIVGGLFDFQVHGLNNDALTYTIVIPQRHSIPENAIYRKYSEQNGWRTFVVDDNNKVYSAPGDIGICPPPRDDRWVEGLTLGHWCVQLMIEDGGPNDADNSTNGAISDPGGVAIYKSSNTMPVAENDVGQMTFNNTEQFNVLHNDSDADGDTLEIISASAILGDVEILLNRRLIYTTLENYVGQDVVNYTISDGNGGTDSATLTITIKGNSAPIATNDNASTTNDKAITIDVLGNDSDIDGDSLSIETVSTDSGTVNITAEQKVRFVPKSGFVGTVTVIYVVVDGKGASDEGKLYISVTEAPTTPTTPTDGGDSDSGGGSFGWILLLLGLAAMFGVRKKTKPEFAPKNT